LSDYVPDKRLSAIFDTVEQAGEDVIEEISPLFSELTDAVDRYADEELLGKGGLKEVYKAYDQHTRQWVALARLRKDRGMQYYDLFVREAWRIASLNHPNIIKVYDAGADQDGRPYFSMDLKRGASLADLITKDKNRDTSALLEIFLKVCDAVAYAHSQGVIHLDLKPENIQCDRFGEVLVCDWGLGKSLTDSVAEQTVDSASQQRMENLTLLGQISGTPGYMAPEQVIAGRTKDERTDVYALGCMLHAVLAGEPPYTGTSEEIMEQTVHQDVPAMRRRFPDAKIPAGLEAVVLKATARDPEARYASAVELKSEIHKYLGGFSTSAESTGFFKEFRLFLGRNKKSSVVALVALIMITTLSFWFVERLGRQQLATNEERARANELMSEVSILSSEFSELTKASDLSKKQLAEQLSWSANSLKDLGIFNQPDEAVEQSLRLANMALSLDPDCVEAQRQRFTLYCLQLNFKQALKGARVQGSDLSNNIRRVAEAFPEFDYTEEKRPDAETFVEFLRKARQMRPGLQGYVERVFVYHHATVSWRKRAPDELAALLEFYNGGPDHCSMLYNMKSDTLSFWSDRPNVVLSASGGGSKRCLLRFIPVRHLSLDVKGTVNLYHLNRMQIESLDLSQCSAVKLPKRLNLPQLKLVRLHKDLPDAEAFKKSIRSNEPFEVEWVN
jgi:serine/threonine-protein kinase